MLVEFDSLKVVRERTTFLDYVYGGCEIDFSVAIDFSVGNGEPNQPETLHTTMEDQQGNKYVQAIKSAVTIMQYYNTTKRIASYGFGARVLPKHEPSQCFSLTGDIFSPEVNGINGLIEAYRVAIDQVTFSD